MRPVICLCLFIFPSWVWGQQCTSYVVVAAYEHKLGADMENLKPDDFQVNVVL